MLDQVLVHQTQGFGVKMYWSLGVGYQHVGFRQDKIMYLEGRSKDIFQHIKCTQKSSSIIFIKWSSMWPESVCGGMVGEGRILQFWANKGGNMMGNKGETYESRPTLPYFFLSKNLSRKWKLKKKLSLGKQRWQYDGEKERDVLVPQIHIWI